MLSHKDFARKTKYNIDTQNQIWMSNIADSHDSWCDCDCPFAHLLASIFPPGHKDRDSTINQILIRDYKQSCLSGGAAEEGHGLEDGEEKPETGFIKEEDPIPPDEVEELLAAAAADVEEGTR